ncbi:MAG: tRNA 2-thiouridine(34) synthase MnmA [Candidatus Nanoperiomorbaceae bacterium]
MDNSQTTVFVGMSGGVDSSLSAALLKQQGYKVVGVYMKNWTEDLPGMICPWKDDLADAKRVAVQLNIPFRVFDFQTEYKKLVVDYMIDEYERGRTPNPDIMCNQDVKFGIFYRAARSAGADLIATGHYARNFNNHLARSKNENKDQTYFLYRMSAESLAHTLFPIGDYKTKAAVRADAAKFGLATAQRPDSQGICFVGEVGVRDFLSNYVETKPGNIVEQATGKVLGRHDGAIFYTFGQRHGLNVGGGLPYYVVGKSMEKNEIYVSKNLNSTEFFRDKITLVDVHWIREKPDPSHQLLARFRHRGALIKCQIMSDQDVKIVIKTDDPQRAVAPGQSVVLYDGEICLGGGIVK